MDELQKALLADFKRMSTKDRERAAELRSGRTRLGSNDGGGWKDITAEWIERYEQNADELDRVVEAYEKRDAE